MADRPIEPYWQMFSQVQAAVEELPHQRLHGISTGEWGEVTELFGAVDLFDATRIELPPTLADWQDTSEEKSGFKLQLKLGGEDRQFKEALITKPDGNDNDYFEDLLDLSEEDRSEEDRSEEDRSEEDRSEEDRSQGEAGDLYLFDCGYWSIDTYHRIEDAGDFFVTKLHGNIKPETACERPVPDRAADPEANAADYRVLSDQYVRLGDDRTDRKGGNANRWYRALTVEVSTEEKVQILTNLLWLEAEQICRLYRHRWSIEIVFRWLKDRMQLDQFISRDPTGVVRQTLTALIVWGLLAIFNGGGEQFSPKKLWRKLQAAMHQALFDFGRRYQQSLDPPT
jgi:Transposase DDE domain.